MKVAIAMAIALLAGCDKFDLERMIDQPRFTSYEACDVCPNGTIMMEPPQGVVARNADIGPRDLMQGSADGGYATYIPIPLDRAMLARGENRFNIYCAACHGRLGNGISQVAENMTLRKPANLLAPPWSKYPPGRTFAVITDGFGLMRSYAGELPVADRWAVVAYLDALRLAEAVPLRELPASVQKEARTWLK